MTNYHCSVCDKKHPVYRGMEMPPPSAITNISERNRLRQNEAFVFVDERRLFANAYLHLFLEGQPAPFFSWSLWAELSVSEYHILQPLLATGNPVKFRGKFSPPPLLYFEENDLSCDVIFFPGSDREPEIIVLTPGKLMTDQAAPIMPARVEALMARVHHYPEDLVTDDAPFTERFRAVLDQARRLYLDEGKDFCINVEGRHAVSLQIGSSAILENAAPDAFGFGIHLPLDAPPVEDAKTDRMRQWPASKEFAYFDLDGIPTYQINVGDARDRLITLVSGLLVNVFMIDVEDVGFDLLEI